MRNRPKSLFVVLRRGGCRLSFLAWLAVASAGCDKVTSENVQLWKTTEKGPGKLSQALRDSRVTPELRGQAALALLDIGQWEEVVAAWTALPAEERGAIAAATLPLATPAMKSPQPEKALLYRDFAFFIRPDLPAPMRASLDAELLALLKAEVKVGRIRNGHVTVDKMLSTLGGGAWTEVADLMGEPVVAYPALAELIARGGDVVARERAGKLLVARTKGQAHPTPELWRSLGVIGGPSVAAFLVEKLRSPPAEREDALAAAKVLVEHPQPQALAPALKIAGDAHADKALRDECFGVVEAVGGPEAVTGLLGILKGSGEPLVRYRAFEAVVGAGKEKVLVEALDDFPATATYKRPDVEDLLVNLIVKLGPAARAPLVKALSSSSPLTRMTAVLSLERVGKSADAPALEARAQDNAKVAGFGPADTIGHEASRVSAALKKKP